MVTAVGDMAGQLLIVNWLKLILIWLKIWWFWFFSLTLPWILACTYLCLTPPGRMAMDPLFWWRMKSFLVEDQKFSGGGSKVFWRRIKSFLVEDENFSGGGSQIQCRAWWLIPEQRCWGMIMVSASNLKDINRPGVLDWCFKNNVHNFCADWTMTIYLHVCSQAQDWSIGSQFSVTSSVQHGLSYCSICTLAQN